MEITVIRILVVLIACIVIYMLVNYVIYTCVNYHRHKKLLNDYEKNHNQVKFYVARDKNGELFLYMGKPFRGIERFHEYQNGCIITGDNNFYNFDLNKNDFDNLKWEDEPVEVFLNLED